MSFTVTDTPLSGRPFVGIGIEADAFIYDEENRRAGVNDDDLALIERRLRALRPGIARLFVYVDWFNPSLDGVTYAWDGADYRNLLRQLRLLQEIGTQVNLVLFQPISANAELLPRLARAMVGLIEHLAEEHIHNIRWLTLYNEPDSFFPHESPLSRRIFSEDIFTSRLPWSAYAAFTIETETLLKAHGLSPAVRLSTPDTVWGHPIRLERLRLAARDLGHLDISYGYHNYSSEDPAFYVDNPDFAYPGMAEEVRMFREIVGAERELVLWEFNTAGAGFNSHFPGIGLHGTDLLGTLDNAVEISDRMLTGMAQGLDGLCLWCLHDMIYCHDQRMLPMPYGLWRYKWQGWYPRPYYYYYALLCHAFRPGARLLQVQGEERNVNVVAARDEHGYTIVLLNRDTKNPTHVTVQAPAPGNATRARVYEDLLPDEGDLPLENAAPITSNNGVFSLELAPAELTVISICCG